MAWTNGALMAVDVTVFRICSIHSEEETVVFIVVVVVVVELAYCHFKHVDELV